MDKMTETFKAHHVKKFVEHGATAKGVDWNDEQEMLFRYMKILKIFERDFEIPLNPPSILDVGCGWGGLLQYCNDKKIPIEYTGIDVVEEMITYAKTRFPENKFIIADIFDYNPENKYDYVVCNAILTQKLEFSIQEMNIFAKSLIKKMFELCKYGISFNLMSTYVNFMVNNLFYKNPLEMMDFCLSELSPKVRIDHGYSSLKTGKGKFYDYTVYVYKD